MPTPFVQALAKQFAKFFGVGVVAAVVHYGVLIGLVELGDMQAVPATLLGYVAGGGVSYALNRAHTYKTERSHTDAGWRFAAVAGVGFLLTSVFMHVLHDRLGIHYMAAQVVTTGIVLVWSFAAHKYWSFRDLG